MIRYLYSSRDDSLKPLTLPNFESKTSVIYDKSSIKYIPQEVIEHLYNEVIENSAGLNWSKYAYVQYATSIDYMCSALINFAKLRRFNTRAQLVLLYNEYYKYDKKLETQKSREAQLLDKFAKIYNVILRPIRLLKFKSESSTWDTSFTKFQIFKLLEFDRIIYFDSDSKIVNGNMDELFFLPDVKVAMPISYHLAKHQGFIWSDHIMVIKPSVEIYKRLMRLTKAKSKDEYDMDIINKLFQIDNILSRDHNKDYIPDALVIPHLNYGVLTGDLRSENHDVLLAEPQDLPYVSSSIFQKLRYIHFSDHPVPKPWRKHIYEHLPDDAKPRIVTDCDSAEIWNSLYEEYEEDRYDICGLELR
ncbi:hypothetical protein PACTADRAFT_44436 [Pachysolen tannophilus NRRL Y-2460]|uniref:Glycosyltransferase family 8 protein n=1 Tax=Pachysolen tannophilus NRRL Y-2460 TaxID=669874 RepID=A0A1E4TQY8_PACTA|nr:hypothetical protein PACTADRAFT_44436 [Pachysolen tannophilus NRRL Y-2460]